MKVDEGLAERLRARLASVDGVSERRMFGGLAFFVTDHMCVGIMGNELIARIGFDQMEPALARPGVRAFDATGRPMRGWVTIGPAAMADEEDLDGWVECSLDFVHGLPPK